MRMPVKLNGGGWPAPVRRLLRASPDPRRLLDTSLKGEEFTEAVGTLKIGKVFKTTDYVRYPKTIRLLTKMHFPQPPVVLDVGASDGSAALAVIDAIEFSRYYVTDRYTEVFAENSAGKVYFFDSEQYPILYAGRFFVVYNDFDGSVWLLRKVGMRIFRRAAMNHDSYKIVLVNPELSTLQAKGVVVQEYDAVTGWQGEKVDIVIVANVLNRGYFSDDRIRIILGNLRDAMTNRGLLAVIENRSTEQSTIFRLDNNRFVIESEVGAGSDIRSVVETLN